ncbi:hypothetical protein RIF29_03533 [Crotalaria pallida]|uniref:Uncharacterized protein n=1 Tax=Crotalaria pallida TaxID=3830 RepID=A0AAN9J2H8_CROPI
MAKKRGRPLKTLLSSAKKKTNDESANDPGPTCDDITLSDVETLEELDSLTPKKAALLLRNIDILRAKIKGKSIEGKDDAINEKETIVLNEKSVIRDETVVQLQTETHAKPATGSIWENFDISKLRNAGEKLQRNVKQVWKERKKPETVEKNNEEASNSQKADDSEKPIEKSVEEGEIVVSKTQATDVEKVQNKNDQEVNSNQGALEMNSEQKASENGNDEEINPWNTVMTRSKAQERYEQSLGKRDQTIQKYAGFKFLNMCTQSSYFLKIVEDVWSTEVEGYAMYRAIDIREKQMKKNLDEVQLKLRDNPLDEDIQKEERMIHSEYMKDLKASVSFLRQKSKEAWISEGDQNTSFYHKAIKLRIYRNRILKIEDGSGQIIEGQQPIMQ